MIAERFLFPGKLVFADGKRWVVVKPVSADTLLLRLLDGNRLAAIHASEVSTLPPVQQNEPARTRVDLTQVSDEAWACAKERLAWIKPLLELGAKRTENDVLEVAQRAGKSTVTLYAWMKAYQRSGGELLSLVRAGRSDKGRTRLHPEVERIVQEAIETEYLVQERPDVAALVEWIKTVCAKKGLRAPDHLTVKARINALPPKQVMAKRYGHKMARETYMPLRGRFPGADYPLAVVQIDHSPLDIIFVDEADREPIGRGHITLAIDVFSRMVLGFYISLDPPGALSTGACLSHAMLPKEEWLAQFGIADAWPCWGIPRMIHADNAKEFRGSMLQRACEQYGITLQNRPKGQPHYGGHVERIFRTCMRWVQRHRGTVFSNVAKKLDYDSEKRAVMTMREFEEAFTIFIVKVYHQRFHRGIRMPPIQKYQDGLLGGDDTPGIGLPAPIRDPRRLRLDFLPFEERSIQQNGVVIEYVEYYHDALRRWVKAPDPKNPKKVRQFIFRIDYRDISEIYFFDPELNDYIVIPYRDLTLPRVSRWEARAARERLQEKGLSSINQQLIFEGITETREIHERATEKTKKARRQQQRRVDNEKVRKKKAAAESSAKPVVLPPKSLDSEEDDVQPFDDIWVDL